MTLSKKFIKTNLASRLNRNEHNNSRVRTLSMSVIKTCIKTHSMVFALRRFSVLYFFAVVVVCLFLI